MAKKEKERYFACPSCCAPITWSKILDECGSGGQGMCYCKYITLSWEEKFKTFEPIYDRVMTEYVEITKTLYDVLVNMNVKDRLQYAYIPDSQLVKEKVYCDKCKEEIVNEKDKSRPREDNS